MFEFVIEPSYRRSLGDKKESIKLTVRCHADLETFLESAFLALISRFFVYHTVSIPFTLIPQILLNCSSKETLK